jgi:predicted MFS family arabinose efflux permease
VDRFRLIVACDLGQAAIFAAIAIFRPDLGPLLALVAASALLATTFGPASRSALVSMVGPDDLLGANAWLGTSLNLQVVFGPLFGAVLFQWWGLRGTMFVNAATFLVSAFLIASLPRLGSRSTESGLLRETWEGIRYVRTNRTILGIVTVMFLAVMFAGVDNVALVFLIQDSLGASPVWFGIAMSAFGVGMFAGSVGVLRRASTIRPKALFVGGWILTSVGEVATGLSPTVWLATAAFTIAGTGNAFEIVSSDTLVQRRVPEALLGRVFGVIGTATLLGASISAAVGGLLLTYMSPGALFVWAGALTFVVALFGWWALPDDQDIASAERSSASDSFPSLDTSIPFTREATVEGEPRNSPPST